MNTKQLFFALAQNNVTKKCFDGIFAKDTLKDIEAPPKLIICNTDTSDSTGEHWVLFHLKNRHMIFYDSLGKHFNFYGSEFNAFVCRWAQTYEFVHERTQPVNTRLCGIYCLYFAYYSCQKSSPHDIIKSMTSKKFVLDVVRRHFSICKYFSCPFLQCCIRL